MNMGTFLLVPNLSAWVQQNLHFPRNSIETLYFVGGLVSLVAMQVGGAIVDRRGSFLTTAFGSLLMVAIVGTSFLPARPLVSVLGIFIVFMLANSVRSVGLNALSTRVPLATERARFMSAQSAVQHLSAALGAVISSLVLVNAADGSLRGMDRLGLLAMALALTVPLFVALVTARVRRREAAVAGPVPSPR
jgi:predicted MFS family arabinose efflux permease